MNKSALNRVWKFVTNTRLWLVLLEILLLLASLGWLVLLTSVMPTVRLVVGLLIILFVVIPLVKVW